MFNSEKTLLSHYFGDETVEAVLSKNPNVLTVVNPIGLHVAALVYTVIQHGLDHSEVYVNMLATACPQRRKGHAQAMFHTMLRSVSAEVGPPLKVCTLDVQMNNYHALALCKKLGFSAVNFDPEMYNNTGGWFMEYHICTSGVPHLG